MSSSPTAATSTTGSSNSSPSPADRACRDPDGLSTGSPTGRRVAVVACGAIAQPVSAIVARRGWPVDVHPLPPLLHNQPQKIAPAVRDLVDRLRPSYDQVVVGYADCGTYGALDGVCDDLGVARLPGLHCYDLYTGASRIEQFLADQPGTYLLTDFLVRSFARTVEQELGLDRYPELRDSYFHNYTRAVWLAQVRDDELEALARKASDAIGLPLTVIDTGLDGLQAQLVTLVEAALTAAGPDASV